jgi:hypothetical protein
LFIVPPQYEIDLVGTDMRPTSWTARSISSSRRMHREGVYRRAIQAGTLYTAGCTKLAVDTAIVKAAPRSLAGLKRAARVERRSRLTFKVDMFQAQGRLPTNLDEVNERDNDIRYSSRTQISSNAFRDRHDVRHAINELHKLLPPDLANTEQAKRLYEYGCVTEMDIVQLVYRPTEPQGASKVCEFSRSSMEVRWQQGISNARTALHASPWLAPTPRELGVRVFDVM